MPGEENEEVNVVTPFVVGGKRRKRSDARRIKDGRTGKKNCAPLSLIP